MSDRPASWKTPDDEGAVPVALPPAQTLRGAPVWLEPITDERHLHALVPALQQEAVFAGGWGGGPAAFTADPEEFVAFLHGYLPPTGRAGVGYAVCMPASGESAEEGVGLVIGTTSFLVAAPEYGPLPAGRADSAGHTGPADGEASGRGEGNSGSAIVPTIEIGCTAYSPQVWGTAVNPEAKLLMLTAAFGAGFERVVFAVDNRNERSQAAVAGLGARRERVLPHHRERADGSWRDTVLFAVTTGDWPSVRASLERRLHR